MLYVRSTLIGYASEVANINGQSNVPVYTDVGMGAQG